ncbi:MAG: ORF6N domain-containing protein [Limisphaerales bacterium]
MDGQVSLIPMERIARAIILVRGEKVMLDTDLAELYGVETKVLNQAVKRNASRFPSDFCFQLSKAEADELNSLRSQIVTLKRGEHRKYLPYAFTEHGALMLANVLNSERAAQTSVQVVRAFVKLRQMLSSNAELARKLDDMEKKYDKQFKVVFDAIRQLMSPPEPKRREMGFHVKYDDDKPKAKKR